MYEDLYLRYGLRRLWASCNSLTKSMLCNEVLMNRNSKSLMKEHPKYTLSSSSCCMSKPPSIYCCLDRSRFYCLPQSEMAAKVRVTFDTSCGYGSSSAQLEARARFFYLTPLADGSRRQHQGCPRAVYQLLLASPQTKCSAY